jgi:YVTN family beta-propeller protein
VRAMPPRYGVNDCFAHASPFGDATGRNYPMGVFSATTQRSAAESRRHSAVRIGGPVLIVLASLVVVGCAGEGTPMAETEPDRGSEPSKAEPAAVGGRAAGRGASRARYAAFVALEDASAVALLRGPPWSVVGRVRVAAGPHNVKASPDGRFIAVSSPPADRVTIFRASGRVLARGRVSGGPHDVAFTRNGSRLWVAAERAGRLVQISVETGRVVRTRTVGGNPHDIAVSPSGRRLWVTVNRSARVEVRSASTGRLLARPLIGGAPHDLAFEPDGSRVWFSNWSSGRLTVVSASTRRRLAMVTAGSEPHHFVFGSGALWVTDNDTGSVVRVNPRRRRVIGRTRVGAAPHHPATAGSQILVAVHGAGRVALVSSAGRLVRSVAVGAGPHGIAAIRISR